MVVYRVRLVKSVCVMLLNALLSTVTRYREVSYRLLYGTSQEASCCAWQGGVDGQFKLPR